MNDGTVIGGLNAWGSSLSGSGKYDAVTWNGTGNTMSLDFSNVTGVAGTDWDLFNVASMAINGSAITLDLNWTSGTAFDGASHNWDIVSARTGGDITGFASNLFTFNTADFAGATGTFNLTLDTNKLVLHYAALGGSSQSSGPGINPVPEPSSIALLLAGSLGLVAYVWRRRRHAA